MEKSSQKVARKLGTAFGDPELFTAEKSGSPAPFDGTGANPAPGVPPIPAYDPVHGTVAYGSPAEPRYLRPPGALTGTAFHAVCNRCGYCVTACPAQAIVMDPAITDGLPHIVARRSPCVVCDDLSCMKACPTGALVLVPEKRQIRMGAVKVDYDRCLRQGRAEDCQMCVTQCPIGAGAIGIDAAGRIEIRLDCTGCGVCEKACPVDPAAVWVEPAG